jgi:hypothetical protein
VADTHGFEVVAEVGPGFLRRVIQAAWKSGGDDGTPGVIPEYFPIPGGETIGPFTIAGGQVQLPQNELDASPAPSVGGIDLRFGLHFQVNIQDPPVPSASLLTMTADVHAKAPVATLGPTINVGIKLGSLGLGDVTASLTSGDPVAPHIDDYMREFVHQLYQANGSEFPHTVTKAHQPLQYLGFTAYYADEFVELFDDPTGRSITVQRVPASPSGQNVEITIPIHFRISNIVKQINLAPNLADPMGADAEVVITAPFETAPGSFTARLSAATAAARNITPQAGTLEGDNYISNKAALGGTLDTFVQNALAQQGQQIAQAWGDTTISHPTVDQIEAFIADAVRQRLVPKGDLPFWQPQTGSSTPVQINDVTPKALSTAIAIAINAGGGADANALTDFISSGRDFAIALSRDRVLTSINDAIHRPESDGGFGPNFPPKHFSNVDGHDADLTRLDISLVPGFIHLDGDVTVVDAIAWSIDVDTSFTDDVGLKWEDIAGGKQRLASDPQDPDIDLGLLGWIIAFILAVILGPIALVVTLIVYLVAEATVESVGSAFVKNSVSHEVDVLGAFPANLVHIGTIDAKFANPVDIGTDGIVFSG